MNSNRVVLVLVFGLWTVVGAVCCHAVGGGVADRFEIDGNLTTGVPATRSDWLDGPSACAVYGWGAEQYRTGRSQDSVSFPVRLGPA
jgi:hypothetical protein